MDTPSNTGVQQPQYKGRGGWRGGGRPKGSKCKHTVIAGQIAAEKRAELQAKYAKHLNELMELKLKMARGEWYVENYEKGTRVVYKKAPDRASIDYLIEFVVGKTPDKLDAKHDIPQIDDLTQALINIANNK